MSALSSADTVRLSGSDVVSIGQQLEFLDDDSGELTIDQVRSVDQSAWTDSDQNILNFGYTDSVYWIRFSALNPTSVIERPLLEISYPVLDHIEAFIYRDGELQQRFSMGDRQPFHDRPIDHPHFVMPLDLYPQQPTEIYLKVQSSSSVQIPMALWPGDTLLEHGYVEALGRSVFYGAMLVMAIYNLLIFISVRETSYLWYVLHVLSTVVLLACIQGVTFQLLWPDASGWNDTAILLSLSGMLMFPCLFVRSFLDVPASRPIMGRLLLGLALLGLLTALGAFVFPYRTMIMTTMVIILVGIISCFCVGVARFRDGFPAAKFYLSAWIFLLSGGVMVIANKFGLLPRNWLTENAAQLGASAEVVLLSFALAYRVNHERRMRHLAQQQSAEAQRLLLEHQMQTNEELDRIVRERTEALEAANAKLTRISSTDALTGVMNRRAFEELFEQEYKRAFREKTPVSLIMVDLDHFKKINDEYGHQIGDLCLIKAAEVMRRCIRRPPDLCARYGGEEFVLLLPNTDLNGAVCVAESIIGGLAANVFCHDDLKFAITASLGVASHIPSDPCERSQLLKTADQLLYAAKTNGRNRVESAMPSATTRISKA